MYGFGSHTSRYKRVGCRPQILYKGDTKKREIGAKFVRMSSCSFIPAFFISWVICWTNRSLFTHCKASEREKSISTLTCFLVGGVKNSWPNSFFKTHFICNRHIVPNLPECVFNIYKRKGWNERAGEVMAPCHVTWFRVSCVTSPDAAITQSTYKREGSLKCNTGSTRRGRFPISNGPPSIRGWLHAHGHQSSVIKRCNLTMAIHRSVIYYLAALLGEIALKIPDGLLLS